MPTYPTDQNIDHGVPEDLSRDPVYLVGLDGPSTPLENGIQHIQPALIVGAVSRKLSMLKVQGDKTQASLWMARLTSCTRTCLTQLSKHKTFGPGLDARTVEPSGVSCHGARFKHHYAS
jgi:hypothetical protein